MRSSAASSRWGGAAGAGLSLGLVAKEAIDFESAIAGLAKATDLSGAGLAAMSEELQELSIRLKTVPLDQVIAIATTGAKLGVAVGDLAEYTEGIVRVSAAMDDIPADQIADQIGKLNIVFESRRQVGPSNSARRSTGSRTPGPHRPRTSSMSPSGSAARRRSRGSSAQETVALAAALLDTGTHAEAAAGTLEQLIAALNQVENRGDFAKVIGISAEEFAGRVRDKPIGAIEDFLVALGKLDAGSRGKALEAIGIEGIRGDRQPQQADRGGRQPDQVCRVRQP